MLIGAKPKFLVAMWKLVLFILILKASILKMKKNYIIVYYRSILDVIEVPHDKKKKNLCNLLQYFIYCLTVGQ
jgi:hypothetical protein